MNDNTGVFYDSEGNKHTTDSAPSASDASGLPAGLAGLVGYSINPGSAGLQNGLIDPNWARNDPMNAQGALTRAQWDDYLARYAPLEDQLIRFVTSDSSKEVEQAGQYAALGSAAAQGALTRDTERRGLVVTPEQAAAAANQSKLQGALDMVGAKNTATRTIADRNFAIQGNLVGMGRGVATTASESLTGAAGLSASREAANNAAAAAGKAQNMQSVGTLAGLGIAAYAAGLI